ncbi:hypothetical protein ECC02_009359 [Trypanosoma cruzi]|uniref:Uncharacterized protein n=1 Tax=Trypanosoma cruzi TaxID=5693 RepID=A0A7J6XU88_TRYCR|nr:hypothetical protein ECC02_009359 [Trypanosoma cruzi]
MCVPRTQRLSSPEKAIVQPRHHFSTERQPTSLVTKSVLAEHCATTHMCVGVCWRSCKEEEHREAHQHSKRHSWMAAMHAVRPQPQQSRTVAAHTHPQKKEEQKKKQTTRRQGVAVCVWRCGCLPALAARKQNKRERNVCSASQALVARSHVTAPSARRSSRPLLMRAAGEAHRAVFMSVSVGVRVEQLGGKHTAPLTGRVQKKQLKEGRVEKKRNVHIDCPPKAKEEKSDVWSEKKKKHKMNLKKVLKCKQKKKLNLQNNKKPKRGTTSARTLIAPVKQNTQTERERGRPLNAMETKQKQLRCSAHAARQDGSGACGAKESTNGPAWVCMQYIQWAHYVCASWDEVRARVHARGHTHRE